MDRPFGGRHKSFTVEHAADERAMKECRQGKDAVAAFLGMRKKKLRPAAHKFIVMHCFSRMNFGCDEH
jgi:hypothetical protein